MVRRLPVALQLLCALAFGALSTSVASADIGFTGAAAIARQLHPGLPLLGLKHRTQNNDAGGYYHSVCIYPDNSAYETNRLSMVDGSVLESGLETFPLQTAITNAAVLERLPLVTVDFGEALALARQATGRGDEQVARIDLTSELFMIFYDVRYNDRERFRVDAITGQVVSDADIATQANALTTAEYAAYLSRAKTYAPGAGYVMFSEKSLATEQGVGVSVMFFRTSNGRVRQVDMLGKQTLVVDYNPIGHLAEIVAFNFQALPRVVVHAPQFIAHVAHTFPGSRMSGMTLKTRLVNGEYQPRWTATVLTAALQSVEFSIDPTVPLANGLAISTVPTTPIVGDLNQDGHVLGDDLVELLSQFTLDYPPYDLDHDGVVGGSDLALLLAHWG